MSGIFGLTRFDGAPIACEEFDVMRASMAHWGPDGVRGWREGATGLGQCLFFDTPEAVHETLPSFSSECRVAFTAEARLDNRDELFDALGVERSERQTIADGELMRRAYLRWGTDCPARLLGDWSLAAWHPLERKLFLARDHHGNTSLHYFSERHRFAFASDRQALLALQGVSRQLNELFLAQVLAAWPAYRGAGTAYRDIYRLPPAHAMLVTADDRRVWRYWHLENAPDVRLATTGEYAEGLREHLRQAVKVRLRSAKPVAVTLSAGLDSGSVAVLAAHELAFAGHTLTAFTGLPVHPVSIPGAITNEFALATATARMATNIHHVGVGSVSPGPLDGIERQLDIHGEPGVAAANYYWLVPLIDAARGHVLLTGQGGNGSISWQGIPHVADVAAALKRGQIVRAAKAAAQMGPIGRAREVCNRLWAESRCAGGQPWRTYSPIHPRFVERLRLRELMAAAGHDPTLASWPRDGRDARLHLLDPGRDPGGALWAELGAAAQVSTRDPTLDVRLLWFLVGVPNRYWRGQQDRWLIREAMRGWLPDEVRLARHRGRQASDVVPRLVAEASMVAVRLLEIEASEDARQYVDVAYLRRVLGTLHATEPGAAMNQAVMIVMRGLATGLFVARAIRRSSGS